MTPIQQVFVRMIRIKPKVDGTYLMQRRIDVIPKCVILQTDGNGKMFVNEMIANKQPIPLIAIPSGTKWSQFINFNVKGNM
jgi:hypothetical protein